MTDSAGTWRLLEVPPRSGAENMARDTGLMERARSTGETVFSVYGWARPTLSLGRNQTARDKYRLDEAARRGIDIVRRPTGGRALLHNREITYSVTAPIDESESLGHAYHRINGILIDGLRRLGVETVEAEMTEPMPQPGTLPCFAAPAEGELVTTSGKLVGSAQFRDNGALLQHGSILIEDDQSLIAELLADAPTAASSSAATIHEALGRVPTAAELSGALFEAVRAMADSRAMYLEEDETRELTARHIEQYSSEWWTWRR